MTRRLFGTRRLIEKIRYISSWSVDDSKVTINEQKENCSPPFVIVNGLAVAMFSKLPYDVEPEQALKHPEVRDRIEAAMKSLTVATDTFLNSIVQSGDKIP